MTNNYFVSLGAECAQFVYKGGKYGKEKKISY